MKFIKLLLVLGVLTISTPNFAQTETSGTFLFDIDLNWLTFNKNLPIDVVADDQVDGGCWTNAKQVVNAVKLEFQRSGFEIYDAESPNAFFFNRVVLTAVGYEVGGTCAVSYNTTLKVVDTDEKSYEDGKYNLSSVYLTLLWSNGGILTGTRSSERLKDAFVGKIQELLLLRVQMIKNMMKEASEAAVEEDTKQYWKSFKIDI
ncbi:MAG: hypothetical protein HWE10_09875 [Gammaproteobacteria bacterium]|nr:hypothetical protein [Gammaproteobacteria bacterium]